MLDSSCCSARTPGCCTTAGAPDLEGRTEEVHLRMPGGEGLCYHGVHAGGGAVECAVEAAVEAGHLSGAPHMASAPGTVGTAGTSHLSLERLDRRRMGPLGERPGRAGAQGTGELIAWLEVAEHVRRWCRWLTDPSRRTGAPLPHSPYPHALSAQATCRHMSRQDPPTWTSISR